MATETRKLGKIGISLKGNYSSTTTYTKLNAVICNGGMYILKVDTSTGVAPTDTTKWISASRGITSVTESISGLNHTYTFTFSDGTTDTFVIKDGYTPKKGTDYYTTEDIASLNIPHKTSDITNDSHFGVTNANNNFSAPQTINGTLTINGDIVQNGASYETHAEVVKSKNDLIVTRDGAVGGLSSGAVSGVKALKYDGTNNSILGIRNDGTAVVGDENGVLEPLATRKENNAMTNGKLVKWNSTTLQLETDDNDSVIKATYLNGTTKPLQSTIGFIGQLYINTSNNRVYQCTSIEEGVYNWTLITNSLPTTYAEYEALTEKENDVFYYCEEV